MLHLFPVSKSLCFAACALLVGVLPSFPLQASQSFETDLQPALQKYCYECHNAEENAGSLNLEKYDTEADFLSHPHLLEDLQWVIGEEEMPPTESKQPPAETRERMVEWLHQTILAIQNAQPNDPGVVVMPRINSEEYDYVIRDLTGIDLGLGQYLTTDGAAGEGFLNVGAAQSMTIGQFEGFLSTSKKLMRHARITPWAGLLWDQSSLSPLEKDEDLRESLKAWWYGAMKDKSNSFVAQHADDVRKAVKMLFGAYYEAAWQYKHRAALGMPNATLEEIAASYEVPLFPNSLRRFWLLFTGEQLGDVKVEPIDNPFSQILSERWNAIPGPESRDKYEKRKMFAALEKSINQLSADNRFGVMRSNELLVRPDDNNKRNKILATIGDEGRFDMTLDLTKSGTGEVYLTVSEMYDGAQGDWVRWQDGEIEFEDGRKMPWKEAIAGFRNKHGQSIEWAAHPTGAALSQDAIVVPGGDYARFTIPEGATRMTVTAAIDPEFEDTTTVAVAPFDHPLKDFTRLPDGYPLAGRVRHGDKKRFKAARQLWKDMGDFNGYFSDRGLSAWLTGESAFYFLPPEVQEAFDVKDQEPWGRKAIFSLTAKETYERMTPEMQQELDRVVDLARDIPTLLQADEETLAHQAQAILRHMALRAWRRVPTEVELHRLVGLYQEERAQGLSWESSIKTPLIAITTAAPFLYRATASQGSEEPYPLQDSEIATRLASTLWASLPDLPLLELAAQKQLTNPDVLQQQVDRMLQDPKAQGFIEQFTGLWLDFNNFHLFSGPDAEKFEVFDQPLKEAMYDEARLFFMDLLQNNRPITEAITADETFLNERLAKHYGIPGVKGPAMRKVKLETDQRGGIVGMGAFLTRNSKPLRTSPVHRGIWVYERVLGHPIPEPPPNVPLLSDEETNEAGETIAEQLSQHRDNPSCFGCHDRFDPLGVALENFDPIGAWRNEVVKGAPVDAVGEFGSGEKVNGISGLRAYLVEHQEEFRTNFARKLIAYMLGREFLLTDQPLLDAVLTNMESYDHSIRSAVQTIVHSPQFLMKRDEAEPNPSASQTDFQHPTDGLAGQAQP